VGQLRSCEVVPSSVPSNPVGWDQSRRRRGAGPPSPRAWEEIACLRPPRQALSTPYETVPSRGLVQSSLFQSPKSGLRCLGSSTTPWPDLRPSCGGSPALLRRVSDLGPWTVGTLDSPAFRTARVPSHHVGGVGHQFCGSPSYRKKVTRPLVKVRKDFQLRSVGQLLCWVNYLLKESVPTHRPISVQCPVHTEGVQSPWTGKRRAPRPFVTTRPTSQPTSRIRS
jgi:hypothetical protein